MNVSTNVVTHYLILGFTGTHVVEAFLAAGYKVRGTVRAVSKILVLQAMWEKKYGAGMFEVAIVEDFTKDGAFDDAMKGELLIIQG